jgi:hypothetical protein
MNSVFVSLPIRTTNPLNGGFGNTKVAGILKAKARASHRNVTRLALLAELRRAGLAPGDLVPAVVSLVRVSAGKMDDDGLAASCKGVRDGIADALGVDDGGRFIRFLYGQRKGPQKHFAIEVRIEGWPS